MGEFKVKVVGAKPPRKPDGKMRRAVKRIRSNMRKALMRPRRIMLAALAGFVLIAGTPHVGWDYECRHPMHGPGSCRSVAWCAYYGIQGRQIAVPRDGRQCGLFKVLPFDWGRLLGGASRSQI